MPAPKPPPAALAAGYTCLVFDEEFNDASRIDLKDTRQPGFTFYPKLAWGKYTLSAEHIQIKDGVLHLFNPENHAQADLFSAVQTGKGSYTGFAAAGGAYFEASIAFDPDFGKKNPATNGFPAFWSNPVEHHFFPQAQRYHYLEMDHMEFNPGWNPAGTGYFHCMHAWTFHNWKEEGHEFVDPVFKNRFVATPASTDFNAFNIYGGLWIPGPDGRMDTFFNDSLLRSLSCRDYPKLLVGDHQHSMVILGCGQWPMRVDWVRVWAKPGAAAVVPGPRS